MNAIGLDIGGTKIEGALVSERGRIIDRLRIPTEAKKGRAHVLNNILDIIKELKERNKRTKISGIGIGFPGFSDKEGRIVNSPNIPLLGFNLKKFMKDRLKTRIFIGNDANCFAFGEYCFGAGKGSSVMLGLIVGTGIGSGIIVDGKVFPGCGGGAGEVGHMQHDMYAKQLVLGKNDFESICSGPNISINFVKAGGKKEDSSPAAIFSSRSRIAKKAVAEEYRNLGILLGNTVSILNPDRIVLGGGVSNVLSPAKVKKEISKFSIPFSASNVKVIKAKLGDDAGVIGAASLVFKG
ncbi:ROK family protein [Candidatus Woesearchaeota archaeon]|nr:ROK family protein [Candidatus Woesearchaeota archaeon]